MKKFTSIAIAFLLVLSVIPAMAADQTGGDREPVVSQATDAAPVTFQAFSKLSATERKDLTPLTETELAAIEGQWGGFNTCNGPALCSQSAIVITANVAVHSFGVWQFNEVNVIQNIGATFSH
jgi:hypothetical protein